MLAETANVVWKKLRRGELTLHKVSGPDVRSSTGILHRFLHPRRALSTPAERVRHVVQSAFNGRTDRDGNYARLCNALLAEFGVSLPGPTLQVACVTSQRDIAMLLRRALLALADHFPQ